MTFRDRTIAARLTKNTACPSTIKSEVLYYM